MQTCWSKIFHFSFPPNLIETIWITREIHTFCLQLYTFYSICKNFYGIIPLILHFIHFSITNSFPWNFRRYYSRLHNTWIIVTFLDDISENSKQKNILHRYFILFNIVQYHLAYLIANYYLLQRKHCFTHTHTHHNLNHLSIDSSIGLSLTSNLLALSNSSTIKPSGVCTKRPFTRNKL